MTKIFPRWINLVTVQSGEYIKINRATELITLNNEIDSLSKKKRGL